MHALVHDLDHLEQVDVSILERVTEVSAMRNFWRSPVVRAIGSTLALLAVIVLLAIVLKSLH
jgi:hypothetical protein